jgi:predicted kinase
VYLRRRPARRALVRRRARYELLRTDGPPVEMWSWNLDRRLDARHNPADFWAAVHEADRAFDEGDSCWVEFPTGRRVPSTGD